MVLKMTNHTQIPCFDFSDTPQYMLEFIQDDKNSFSYSYSYMSCWELIENSTLIFKFMNEEIRVEGKNLHLLKSYISKHQMRFLKINSNLEILKNLENPTIPMINCISKNEDVF